jgi:serine/threonine-protein kinase RsbW
VLVCSVVDAGPGTAAFGAVPAADRAAVRAAAREEVGRIELPVTRRGMRTYESGPPPVVVPPIDPAERGAAAVAVALTAAMEAHPTATPPQTAAIAGSILAGAAERDPADAAEVGDEFVRLHAALGSDAHVVTARDDVIELAVTRCPFGVAGAGSSLCHVSSGLAGQLAARVGGSATVVLDESVADGDPECHLQVRLGPAESDQDGQPHFWPPHAISNTQTVPNLDLSVSLPRESVSVPVVRRLAAQALRAFGVYDEDVDDVQLAITEACANVIDHAAETDTYEVKIELAVDRCALTIVDQGSGFDAGGVPDQAEHDAEMGRGLALMRALVDNVAFRNEPQAGAVVHMVKTLRYDTNHPLRRIGR